MSQGLNKVMLIGNLGLDPEHKKLENGNQVANMRVAVSRSFKNKEGEKQEDTEWFNVECWGPLAESVGRYLTKGRRVFIEGRLRTRSWEDATTHEKKYRTEVVANDVQFLDRPAEAEASKDIPF